LGQSWEVVRLTLVLLGSVLRLCVRFHLLLRSQLANPSVGLPFASVALYLHFRSQSPPPMPIVDLLVMGFVLGPVFEESVLRGCLLPVLAQTIE